MYSKKFHKNKKLLNLSGMTNLFPHKKLPYFCKKLWNFNKNNCLQHSPGKWDERTWEVIYSMMGLIKPRKYNNNQYYADNHLGERSKR